MDHGGEAPTTVGSTDLGLAGTVQGGEANIGSCAFDGQLGAAAAALGSFSEFDRSGEHHSSTGFARQVRAVARRGDAAAVFHLHSQLGPGVAYPSTGEFWRQPVPVGVVLVGPKLPDGVMPVLDNDGYSALQPHPGAGPGEVLVSLLRGGSGHGEVLVDQLSDGVGEVFDNSRNFAQQTPPGTGRADGIASALRDPYLGAGYDGSGALADNLSALYDGPGMAVEHRHRLLAFVGIGASSVAVNGLAASPGSPAVAFHFFVLLLAGLFLVILHVLRA